MIAWGGKGHGKESPRKCLNGYHPIFSPDYDTVLMGWYTTIGFYCIFPYC